MLFLVTQCPVQGFCGPALSLTHDAPPDGMVYQQQLCNHPDGILLLRLSQDVV